MSGASPSPPDSSLDEATEEGFILVREGGDSKGIVILLRKCLMDIYFLPLTAVGMRVCFRAKIFFLRVLLLPVVAYLILCVANVSTP